MSSAPVTPESTIVLKDMGFNPVIVHPGGALIVDARIRVEAV